jgi:hypothetical protein
MISIEEDQYNQTILFTEKGIEESKKNYPISSRNKIKN